MTFEHLGLQVSSGIFHQLEMSMNFTIRRYACCQLSPSPANACYPRENASRRYQQYYIDQQLIGQLQGEVNAIRVGWCIDPVGQLCLQRGLPPLDHGLFLH